MSTTRLAGDFDFQQNATRGEITSGFNEVVLVQSVNMISRKPLQTPILTAAGTTKSVNQIHHRHFILRANTSAKVIA